MSVVNIKGLIKNIKARTTAYTPIIEAIMNSIQAIDDSHRKDGKIIVTIKRSAQQTVQFENGALPDISCIEICDNGIGFNEQNKNSFNTLYSDLKAPIGGKGFGRFMFLKYFDCVNIESIYKENGNYFHRSFNFGKNEEIIENEIIKETNENDTKTIIYLNEFKEGSLEKKLEALARNLLEKLLIYFINDNYSCPKIIIKEESREEGIVLNDFLFNKELAEICEITSREFILENANKHEKFKIKLFKIFFQNSQKSKISLTAHNREVTETPLYNYIPEFEDDFYEEFTGENGAFVRKNYIIKAYLLSDYLDNHVSLERGCFNFPAKNDLFYPFGQEEIERKAAEIAKELFEDEVKIRANKKREKINEYVKNAPWHQDYLEDIDISSIPYNLTDEIIEMELHKAKFRQERAVKAEANKIINNPDIEIDESVQNIMNKLSKAEMSNLAHYIALRKTILGLFKRSLEIKENGKYTSENAIHSIIFPTRSDSDSTPYDNHNLWIIDEKLNFTQYISSDLPLDGGTSERGDLLIFNNKMVFRADNEASNPITIFEFKKPQRDDFVNQSSPEDPVQQIIRYVNNIKDGKYKTPKGRDIAVGNNTPFYGFVICDLTKKVTTWLSREKDFKPMPDGQGWFQWYANNNLYIEVISWDKLLKDAEMRNKIFFHKLGLV